MSCQVIKRAVRNVYEMGLEDFIFGHPAQIALLGIQFQWTADTQAALVVAKSDKTIMTKNMKKTDALLKCVCCCSAPTGPANPATANALHTRECVLHTPASNFATMLCCAAAGRWSRSRCAQS